MAIGPQELRAMEIRAFGPCPKAKGHFDWTSFLKGFLVGVIVAALYHGFIAKAHAQGAGGPGSTPTRQAPVIITYPSGGGSGPAQRGRRLFRRSGSAHNRAARRQRLLRNVAKLTKGAEE